MFAKYTPGPWKVYSDPRFPRLRAIQLSDGSEFEPHAAASNDSEVANLRLAAAAPDLLEACIKAEHAMEQGGRADQAEALSALDRAIAKAGVRR